MYSIQKDRKESTVENDVQHTKLDLTKNIRGIVCAKHICNSIGFENSHSKRDPGNRA